MAQSSICSAIDALFSRLYFYSNFFLTYALIEIERKCFVSSLDKNVISYEVFSGIRLSIMRTVFLKRLTEWLCEVEIKVQSYFCWVIPNQIQVDGFLLQYFALRGNKFLATELYRDEWNFLTIIVQLFYVRTRSALIFRHWLISSLHWEQSSCITKTPHILEVGFYGLSWTVWRLWYNEWTNDFIVEVKSSSSSYYFKFRKRKLSHTITFVDKYEE